MQTSRRFLTAGVVGALCTGAANADLTTFTDQAAWETALIDMGFSPFTETFDGISIPDMQPGDGPFDINGDFSITVEGQPDDFGTARIANGIFEGEIFPATGHSAYVHTFNQPIMGFGQFFDGAATGLGLRLETTEGTIDIFDDGGFSGSDDGFFGFISSAPITEVRVIGSDANGGSAVGEIYDALDASYAIVPAPGALALLGIAAAGSRRRRRH